MKLIDLSFDRYNILVSDGNIDDETYGEWFNHEVGDWLRVAKNKYNQSYIKIKGNGGNIVIAYDEWFGDES